MFCCCGLLVMDRQLLCCKSGNAFKNIFRLFDERTKIKMALLTIKSKCLEWKLWSYPKVEFQRASTLGEFSIFRDISVTVLDLVWLKTYSFLFFNSSLSLEPVCAGYLLLDKANASGVAMLSTHTRIIVQIWRTVIIKWGTNSEVFPEK